MTTLSKLNIRKRFSLLFTIAGIVTMLCGYGPSGLLSDDALSQEPTDAPPTINLDEVSMEGMWLPVVEVKPKADS